MKRVLGNVSYEGKVKGQIFNFLVKASPPKTFDVVTSNSVGAYQALLVHRSHDVEGTGQHSV